MQQPKYIGIDIGGTKIHIGVVQNGAVVQEKRFETAAAAPQEQILAELANHLEELIDADVAGVGIGTPGLVEEENGIIYNVQNIPSWQQVPLRQFLAGRFGKPVYITNDANAFAVGEKMYGQGRPYAHLVGLVLGTGVGAGLILNHDVHAGVLSSAGEFGCLPYRDKTFEEYCSGKFFTQQTGRPGSEWHALARQGDPAALAVLTEYGRHLGHLIKSILFTVAPQAVFLGGSVSKCFAYFQEGLHESLREFPFPKVVEQLVVAPSTLDNAAVLGAAALCHLKQELPSHPSTAPSL
ncbi:ROK family protein [Hymenobacter endophyticus]|uniref:ROK family protein n=1 Tax=Hymenobacter endophyticus TaxID=3076335 RepID=A0ABU3TN85_9BACT|nr:ROK family protein [Hymenobacter endophyticus]MDU0372848.1 ROK family protein [Hymenobacter endophyticus]